MKFVNGDHQNLRGHAWAFPCYGGFAGFLWFTDQGKKPLPNGCRIVLGKAIFDTREEARVARANIEDSNRRGLEAPVRVLLRLERAS